MFLSHDTHIILFFFPAAVRSRGFLFSGIFTIFAVSDNKKPAGINPAGSSYWLTSTGYFGFLYQCMFDGAEWVARWQMLHSVTTSSMCSSS